MKKPKQATAIARQKAHGESLREWLQDRAAVAAKRMAEARKRAAAAPQPSRGVDRVPRSRQPEHSVPSPRVPHERDRALAGKARIRARRAARR